VELEVLTELPRLVELLKWLAEAGLTNLAEGLVLFMPVEGMGFQTLVFCE